MAKGRTVKTKGATGMSVLEIALNLKLQNPTAKFEDLQSQAKDIKDAETTLTNNGSNLRNKIYSTILGKKVGGAASKFFANRDALSIAGDKLANFHAATTQYEQGASEKASAIPREQVEKIMGALAVIDTKIEKIIKMAQPIPKTESRNVGQQLPTAAKTVNQEALADAHQALIGMGFKKPELDDLTKNVSPDATTQEILRHALAIRHNQLNPKAQRLVPHQVAQAVAEVREQVPSTAFVGPPVQEQPKHDEIAKVVAPLSTQTINSGPANQDEQSEAQKIQAALKAEKERREQEKRQEDIEDELKKIEKTLEGLSEKSGNQMINSILGWLAKKLGGLIWSAVKPFLEGAWNMLKNAVKRGGKALFEELSFGAGEGGLMAAATVAGDAVGIGEVATLAYGTGRMVFGKDKEEIINKEDKWLDTFGIKSNKTKKGFNDGTYTIGGKRVDSAHLTQPQKDIIGMAAEVANPSLGRDHESMAAKERRKANPELYTKAAISQVASDAVMPEPASATAINPKPQSSALLDATPMPQAAMVDHPTGSGTNTVTKPVILNNNKTIVQKAPVAASPVIVKARNDEPSVAGLTAQLFDHPVAYGAVYRM